MSKALVSALFEQSSEVGKLRDAIASSENKTIISSLVGSSYSIAIAEVFKQADKPFLIILNNKEEAA